MDDATARARLYWACFEALKARVTWLRTCVAVCAARPDRPGFGLHTAALAQHRAALTALDAIDDDAFDMAAWLACGHGALTRAALADRVPELESDLAAAREALARAVPVPAPTNAEVAS